MVRHWLGVTLALIGLSMAAAPRLQAQEAGPTADGGAVNIIYPEIYLTPAGDEERRIGMPVILTAGDSLRTGPTGVALITWLRDGTESVLGPGTQLAVERLAGDLEGGFDVALALAGGQLRIGIGDLGAAGGASVWRVTTPAFETRLAQGRFELRVRADGQSTLIVTEGSADLAAPAGGEQRLQAHEFVTVRPGSAPGDPQRLSLDGVTVALDDVCTGEARANVNVRLAPSESSRRLGGLIEGQRFWVRAATEGRLWLQIYFRTGEDDREAHNFGWVYGPIAALDEAQCADLLRAPLDAQIFGGPGVGDGDESAAPAETETPTASGG